jgi:hypothetical protein
MVHRAAIAPLQIRKELRQFRPVGTLQDMGEIVVQRNAALFRGSALSATSFMEDIQALATAPNRDRDPFVMLDG